MTLIMNLRQRQRVIFVGSFSEVKGGVGLDCKSLLEHPLLGDIDWIKVNSAMRSLPPPGFMVRLWFAALRMVRFCALILRPRTRVLIFSSGGASFVEKGAMAILARLAGHRITFCPRSGYLQDDLRNSRCMRYIARLVFRSSEFVICQGPSWKRVFSDFVQNEGKLIVLPNLIDASDYLALSPAGPAAVVRHVLMLGWMEQNKGLLDLVKLREQYPSDYMGITFHLCGEGSIKSALEQRLRAAEMSESFSLPGWVRGEEKSRLLGQANLFLVLSYREGLPNALLEAMAAGKAILATRVGSIPDVIEDGVDGLLCDPGNLGQIHSALQKLICNPCLRAELGANARKKFVANYNLQTADEKWVKVLYDPATKS